MRDILLILGVTGLILGGIAITKVLGEIKELLSRLLDEVRKLESLVRFAEAYSGVHKEIAEELHRIKAEQEMAKILREAKEKERGSSAKR